MTDSEQDRCILETIEAHKAARRRLECLRRKAAKLRSAMQEVEAVLSGKKEGGYLTDPLYFLRPLLFGKPGQDAGWLTAEGVEELIRETEAAAELVAELAQSRKELGVDD